MNRRFKRFLAFVMAFVILLPNMVFADTQQYTYLECCEVPEAITSNNLFYIASSSAEIVENSGSIYVFSVKRGGSCEGEASVDLKISDVTAKYGKDYKIKIHNSGLLGEKTDVPDDNKSLLEIMQESEYEENVIDKDEMQQAMQDEAVSGAAVEVLEGMYENIYGEASADEGEAEDEEKSDEAEIWAEEVDPQSETEQETEAETAEAEGAAETASSESPEELGKTLQGARQLYTGIESDRVEQEGNLSLVDTLTGYQQQADELTNALLGAVLHIDFEAGEAEKQIDIVPINNSESDGARIFTIMLSNPSEGYTNSAISNLVATIKDDEPEVKPVVGFSQASYSAQDGVIKAELVREGSLNGLITVTLKSESSTAVSGRDFSPVNSEVAFPIGIDKRTVEIPVRGDYISESSEFKLYITDEKGCEIGDKSEAVGLIEPTEAETKAEAQNAAVKSLQAENSEANEDGAPLVALSTNNSYSNVRRHADVMDFNNYGSKGGECYIVDNNGAYYYCLTSDNGKSAYTDFYFDKQKSVRYDIDGVLVDWERDSGIPSWGNLATYTGYRDTSGNIKYDRLYKTDKERWNRKTNFFNLKKEGVLYFSIKNWNDKKKVFTNWNVFDNIYSITPIKREFKINLKAAAGLKYLNENGEYAVNNEAVAAKFSGLSSSGDSNTSLTRYAGEKITVKADTKTGNAPIARITGIAICKSGLPDKVIATLPDTSSATEVSFTLDNNLLTKYLNYVTFEKDGDDIKGSFSVRPIFGYYDKTVRIYSSPKGYFNDFAGNNFNVASGYKDFTFHVGDVIALTSTVNPAYANNYAATGVKFKRKRSKLKAEFDETGVMDYSAANNYRYVSNDDWLKDEYLEIEPLFQAKNNIIVVKVPTDQIEKFDTTKGIFASKESYVEGDYTYYLVCDADDTKYLSTYNLFAYTKDTENAVPLWQETKNDNIYSGSTFYYTARDTAEDNVITLTLGNKSTEFFALSEKVNSLLSDVTAARDKMMSEWETKEKKYNSYLFSIKTGSDEEYTEHLYEIYKTALEKYKETSKIYNAKLLEYKQAVDDYNKYMSNLDVSDDMMTGLMSFSGNVLHADNYNISTSRTAKGGIAAAGAVIAAAGGGDICNADGKFKTKPALYAYGTKVRYMIGYEGKNTIAEVDLPTSKIRQEDYTYIDDDGKETTVKTEVVNLGELYASVVSNSTVGVNDIVVRNGTGILDEVPINDSPVVIDVYVKDGVKYKRDSIDSDFKTVQTDAEEHITAVTFKVYDPKENKFKGEFEAKKSEKDSLLWSYAGTFMTGAKKEYDTDDLLYVSVTSDKSGDVVKTDYDENGNVINQTVSSQPIGNYSNLYTGFKFTQPADEGLPQPQQFDLPTNAEGGGYIDMPLVGNADIDFSFPYISVSLTKDEVTNIYRMSFGVNIGSFISKPGSGGTKLDSYGEDTLKKYKDIFTVKDPSTYMTGLKESIKDTVKGNQRFNGVTNAMVSPSFKFNVTVGLYFDFGVLEEYDPDLDFTYSYYALVGGGGYLGMSAGLRVSVYALIPVIYIPFYFGFEGEGALQYSMGATKSDKLTIKKSDMNNKSMDLDSGLDFNGILEASLMVSVYCGVGICGTIGVRGSGDINMAYIYYPLSTKYYNGISTPHGMTATLQLGFKVDALLFTIPIMWEIGEPLKVGFYKDVQKATVKGAASETEAQAASNSLKALSSSSYTQGESSGVYLRQGNSGESRWLPGDIVAMSGFESVNKTTLVQNGYERPDSQLINMGNGKMLLAFLDNDNSRGELERSVLKISVYDGAQWKQPVVVQNDGTADFSPILCDAGDSVAIAWMSSDPESVKTGDPTQYLGTQEIYTTLINKETEAIGTIERLTNDDYYDFEPTIMYDSVSGDIAVYYIKSSLKATFEESVDPNKNDCIVTYMLYDGAQQKWLRNYYYPNEVSDEEAAAVLIENWGGQRFLSSPIDEFNMNDPLIMDLSSISYNSLGIYAYTVDADNNKETNTDRELFVQVYDFSTHKTYMPIRVTNDSQSDSLPQFVRGGRGVEEQTYLYWYTGENTISSINVTDLVKEGINDDGTIKSDYNIEPNVFMPTSQAQNGDEAGKGSELSSYKVVKDGNDNTYIIWVQPKSSEVNGERVPAQEVFAAAYINAPEDEAVDEGAEPEVHSSWSNSYQLTKSGLYNDEVCGAIDDNGNLIVVHNQFVQTLTKDEQDPVKISNLKLVAEKMAPKGEMNPVSIELSDYTPAAGETVDVNVTLQNQGLTRALGYNVSIVDNRLNTVTSQSFEDEVLPGSYVNHTFTWTVPENIDGSYVTVIGQEKGMSNSASLDSEPLRNKAEYAVEGLNIVQEEDGLYAEYAVTNIGNRTSESDDKVVIGYENTYGPADMFGITEEIFAENPVGNIETGNTQSYKVKLENIPAEAFEAYGYFNICVAVSDAEGENWLSDGTAAAATLVRPLEFTVNDGVNEITLNQGETLELKAQFEPYGRFKGGNVGYSVDNTGVAQVTDGILTAVGGGDTSLKAIVNPYGNTVTLNVHVEGSSEETTEYMPEFTTVELPEIEDISEYTTAESDYVSRGGGGSSSRKAQTVTETTTETEVNTDEATEATTEATEIGGNDKFVDISEHWAKETINRIAEKGVVNGYEDNTFKPNGSITRAEFLTILYNSGLADTSKANTDIGFADVSGEEWYCDYVKWGAANNLIVGYEDNTFRGNNTITRQEMAVVISKFIDLAGIELDKTQAAEFADKDDIALWAKSFVDSISEYGVVKGDDNNCFLPRKDLTRAETAVIIDRLIK